MHRGAPGHGLKARGAVPPYRLSMAPKRPAPKDAAAARRILLDGLARDAQVFELLAELEPLHPRNDTFPGEVFLRLAADALDWSGPAAPAHCRWKACGSSSCPNPRSAAHRARSSSTRSWPRRRSTGEPSRTCSMRSPGGRPMTSGSTPSTPRLPTSAPPLAKQASPCGRHARTWPTAQGTPRHNTHHGAAREDHADP